jgi:hypothetical protein
VKRARKFVVLKTFIRSNENSPWLKQMMKMLLPGPNELSGATEELADFLEFFRNS